MTESLDLDGRAESVPEARQFVRNMLLRWQLDDLSGDAELVVSELVANAVIHAGGAVRVVLQRGPVEGELRIEVRDTSPVPPSPRLQTSDGFTPPSMTGRGLQLVQALSHGWGATPDANGPGKTVWAVLGRKLATAADDVAPATGDELDALLAGWDDLAGPSESLYEVTVGDVSTDFMMAAKDHLDGLVRELTLASGDGTSALGTALPAELVTSINQALSRFADVRRQIRELCLRAMAHEEPRVVLALRVSADVAETGEAYLAALEAADTYARDARLLTLESPVQYRALRRWYVRGLIEAVRRAQAGLPPEPYETFEQHLVRELDELAERSRRNELAAKLQSVTAALAEHETPQAVAATAVEEGVRALGAVGGTVLVDEPGGFRALASTGVDDVLPDRLQGRGPSLHGPSREAFTSATPVWVEDLAQRNALFPHLADLQPEAAAIAALPLVVTGDVVGVLRFAFGTSRAFSSGERQYLVALAAQTAQAVVRAQAMQELTKLRDELEQLLAQPADPGHASATEAGLSAIDLALLRTLYEDAQIGVAVLDRQGNYLRVNRGIAAANGPRTSEHFGQAIEDVLEPTSASEVRSRVERVIASETAIVDDDIAARDAHGVPRIWRASWFPVRTASGGVDAVVVVASEVTEQRRLEDRTRLLARAGEALAGARSVPELLSVTADLVLPTLGVWCAVHLVDGSGRITCAMSRHVDPHLGAALNELLSRFPVTTEQPFGAGYVIATGQTQYLPEVSDEVIEAVAGGDEEFVAVMHRLEVSNGAIAPLVAHGRTLGALSVARASEQVLTEDEVAFLEDLGRRVGMALQNAQALTDSVRLDLALNAAELGSFDMDVETGVAVWDDRLLRLLHIDSSNFTGSLEPFFSRVLRDDVPAVRAAMEHAIRTVGELEVSYRIRLPDNSVRWIEARGRAIPGPDGAAARLIGTAMDVTEQRERRDRVLRALEVMSDAFVAFDTEWRFTYVNREAERMLLRPRSELLGRSLWEEFPQAVGSRFEEEYRRAVSTGTSLRFEGYYPPLDRHLEVRVHPTPEGLSVYFTDIGPKRAMVAARDRAIGRLALLNRIGAHLSETLDVEEGLERLAHLLLPELADLVTIDLRDGPLATEAPVIAGVDEERVRQMRRADSLRQRRLNPASGVARVLAGEPWVLMNTGLEEHISALSASEEQRSHAAAVGVRALLVVPLLARGRVFGAISLIRTDGVTPEAAPYTEDDVGLAAEIGRRAGLMIDNAVQYTAQRSVAEALQRNLLPQLPSAPGLVLGAAYEPGSASAKVGGDWYDAFALPEGDLGVVVGDVMGHDVAAAAAMGQLRSVLRSCAVDGDPPAAVLDRLDRLVNSFAMADLATVVYARLHRRPDGSADLTYANAGHPPPLVLLPDGTTRALASGASTMIGVPGEQRRNEAVEHLPLGSALLMFTDGLVERRGGDIEEELSQLAVQAAELWQRSTPQELCDALIATVRRSDQTDDAAALVVHLA